MEDKLINNKEDNIEDNDNQNQNEEKKLIKQEQKKTEEIQVEEISGNSKKKIIIFVVLAVILILIAIALILVFTLKDKGDIEVLEPLIMNSTSGNHTHTIIFMPGLTNQPEDFNKTFTSKIQFSKKNDTTIIILRSPYTYVTLFKSKNYSWFDVYKKPLTDFSDINLDELKTKSARVLEKVINNEVNILNGDYSKIIIGGHSQGACISLYQAYTSNKKYGGLFAFSGLLPPADISDDKNDLNAWIGYGDKDDMISPSFMNKTLSTIAHFKGVEIHIYENLTHYVKTEEAKDAAKFLDRIIK